MVSKTYLEQLGAEKVTYALGPTTFLTLSPGRLAFGTIRGCGKDDHLTIHNIDDEGEGTLFYEIFYSVTSEQRGVIAQGMQSTHRQRKTT